MKLLFRQFHKKLQKNPKFTPIDHRNMKRLSLIIDLYSRVLKNLGETGVGRLSKRFKVLSSDLSICPDLSDKTDSAYVLFEYRNYM